MMFLKHTLEFVANEMPRFAQHTVDQKMIVRHSQSSLLGELGTPFLCFYHSLKAVDKARPRSIA